MIDRLVPDNVLWDGETCEELGILNPDDPYDPETIPEDEVIEIIKKEYELTQVFLGKFVGSWWGEGDEDNRYMVLYHGEDEKKRTHKGVEYNVTERAYGLWNEFESITLRYIEEDLSMGCISGSRLRFERELLRWAKEKGWHLEYKNKKVKKAGIEGYTDKDYLDRVYIQKRLK